MLEHADEVPICGQDRISVHRISGIHFDLHPVKGSSANGMAPYYWTALVVQLLSQSLGRSRWTNNNDYLQESKYWIPAESYTQREKATHRGSLIS